MRKYSIILRAHNAETKLHISIDSILEQSYANWQLIIVNDGSTDNTGQICDQYASKDFRIKVIHQENSGCLLATQSGIKHADGEYICVLDADDWYEPNYLEYVDNILSKQKVDMVVVNYYLVKSGKAKTKFYPPCEDYIIDSKKAMMEFFQSTNYALWNKVVARDLIEYSKKENDFFNFYRKSTNFGEDLYQLMPVLCKCDNVYFTSECLYNYVIDDTSISHQKVNNYEDELNKRNRLMQFTYETLENHQCMSEQIKRQIQINTVVILLPTIKRLIKSKSINRKKLMELKTSDFYWNVVRRTSLLELKNRVGVKNAAAFWGFNQILFWIF